VEMGIVDQVIDGNLSLYPIAYLIGGVELNHCFVYKGELC